MGATNRTTVKIVVNARFLCQPLTGIQRFAIEISLRLKTIYGANIVFVAPNNVQHLDISKKLDVLIIGKNKGQIWEQLDLFSFLKKQGSPLLLCLGGGAPLFYKNLLFTIHDIAYVRFPKSYSYAYRLFYKIQMPIVLKHARKIITVSEFSKGEICNYYNISFDKVAVVYNAVDEIFKEGYSFVAGENLAPYKKYYLAVSSPAYHKNFPFLVDAFSKAELSADTHLCVVGNLDSGVFKSSDLLTRAKSNKNIHFLGRVSDEMLVRLYRHAFAFVFPSLYEGFGIPPLEAQACACPVLSSDVASMPEILKDSALYFSPTDENSLVRLFENLELSDSFSKLQQAKQSSLLNLKRFDWMISAQTIQKLIIRLYEK